MPVKLQDPTELPTPRPYGEPYRQFCNDAERLYAGLLYRAFGTLNPGDLACEQNVYFDFRWFYENSFPLLCEWNRGHDNQVRVWVERTWVAITSPLARFEPFDGIPLDFHLSFQEMNKIFDCIRGLSPAIKAIELLSLKPKSPALPSLDLGERGKQRIVNGEKKCLTGKQQQVVQLLCEAYPKHLSEKQLQEKASKRTRQAAPKILRELAASDPYWRDRLKSGGPHLGFWIEKPGDATPQGSEG
jgi:hypothetical protein